MPKLHRLLWYTDYAVYHLRPLRLRNHRLAQTVLDRFPDYLFVGAAYKL